MADKLYLSETVIWTAVEKVHEHIRSMGRVTGSIPAIYGIPRGGKHVTDRLTLVKDGGLTAFTITQNQYKADIFIDDLIDSGTTRSQFKRLFPNVPFLALFDKQTDPELKDKWLVFPWEVEDGVDTSADDIVIRLLQRIGEDPERGGLKETPKRFIKAWEEYTKGYEQKPEDVLKTFEDGAEQYDEMVLVKDIPVYSHCEHHLAPFFGVAHVAYIPNGKVVGLSKIPRLVDIYAKRLQIQERLTNQIAQALTDNLKPKGVAVVLECRHFCMECRGVKLQGVSTTTSAMKGAFFSEVATRAEFMGLIK